MNRVWRESFAWGFALWLAATVALALGGDYVLAPLEETRGVVVVVTATLLTAALLVPLTRLFVGRGGSALIFSVGAGGTGLGLDGLLLLVRRFDYPGVAAAKTPALATALLCAYAAFVLVPPLVGREPA